MNGLIARYAGVLTGVAMLALFAVCMLATVTYTSQLAYAQDGEKICQPGEGPEEDECSIVELPDGKASSDPALKGSSDGGIIERYFNPFIAFLAIIVGIIATISIVIGGIQYAASEDDPQKVAKAKSRIINAILAVLAFLLLYAFLQWLVPGGITG